LDEKDQILRFWRDVIINAGRKVGALLNLIKLR
jgi:hypothetical protein